MNPTHQWLHALLPDGVLVGVEPPHGPRGVPQDEAREAVEEGVESGGNNGQRAAGHRRDDLGKEEEDVGDVGHVDGVLLVALEALLGGLLLGGREAGGGRDVGRTCRDVRTQADRHARTHRTTHAYTRMHTRMHTRTHAHTCHTVAHTHLKEYGEVTREEARGVRNLPSPNTVPCGQSQGSKRQKITPPVGCKRAGQARKVQSLTCKLGCSRLSDS